LRPEFRSISFGSELPVFETLTGFGSFLAETYGRLFFTFSPSISVPSLLSALLVAYLCVTWKRKLARRRTKLKVLIRAFFPRRLFNTPSPRADLGLFVLNTSIFTVILGGAILSAHVVATLVHGQLVGLFGQPQLTTLTMLQMSLIMTVAMFLAYELSYFTDHYLAHTVPFLWEFHKVHHAAETLTPLTNFRVHPVDTLVFYNITAVIMGCTMGALNYLFGTAATEFSLAHSNIIVFVFVYLIGHLQHSHFWIAFTGTWGRLFLSPAHHQIHHSTNPIHFNRNLGHCLGVFDWMFGTLHIPAAKREKLTFGVDPNPANRHSVAELLIAPFGHALANITPAKASTDEASATPTAR
jgi:sterol desaturase/sphingolipid hydroxylase (fatty acid hydroxylase superfamily)